MTKRNRIATNCQKCGAGMEVTPYRLANGRGKYCSRYCQDQQLRENGGICNAVKFVKGKKPINFRGWAWSSGKYKLIFRPDHPNATASGYVREHRLVVEAHIGRYLEPTEEVHHIDHNKLNNDISNLIVLSKSEHASLHAQERRNNAPSHSFVT